MNEVGFFFRGNSGRLRGILGEILPDSPPKSFSYGDGKAQPLPNAWKDGREPYTRYDPRKGIIPFGKQFPEHVLHIISRTRPLIIAAQKEGESVS